MECVCGVFIATAHPAGCTLLQSEMDSNHPKHDGNHRNLHQLLKGKHLYSVPYGVYTEMLPDLTTVLTDGSAKGETAKTTITESPSK
jgi:hypothetical protein